MRLLLLLLLLSFTYKVESQRTYATHSVQAAGNWYKLSVSEPGIYKVTIPLLNSLGINTNGLASGSLRLYGSNGGMLSEANNIGRLDDLAEIAISVVDGGDGVMDNQDYFLFYAQGADQWKYDSANSRFVHFKNLYSDQSFFYLTIGGSGKRIQLAAPSSAAGSQVQSYDYRYFHETDSINFLSSGKNWYGEEFSSRPGKSLERLFNLTIPNINSGSNLMIYSDVASRSSVSFSRFEIRINNSIVLQHNVPFTGNGAYDPFAVAANGSGSVIVSQPSIAVRYSYAPANVNAQGWLNHFELHGRASLNMSGIDQLNFRDLQSVSAGNRVEYKILNAASAQVWQVTDPLVPVLMNSTISGSDLRFTWQADKLYEFIAFTQNNFKTPTTIGVVPNQDLHNSQPADLLIITDASLLSQANRLADVHKQKDNLKSVVVTTSQVYNEFAGGTPDPVATRDFVKMYFDKAGSTISLRPKYLLLFGAASFDYKSRIDNNTNLVPTFQSLNSVDPLASYCSDDFFGFLDDTDDINNVSAINLLDIGIGRIPAKNLNEAKAAVDKIVAYFSPESFGPWRNDITIVADDEDNNMHLQDAESISGILQNNAAELNIGKVYLDAYNQQSGSGGTRYPDANSVISNRMYAGNLIWNYLGHGSHRRLAEETILDQELVNSFNNQHKLPLFITATCDFAPFDNPSLSSLGADLLLRPKTGAIALLSSSRVVFANSNKIINENFLTALTTRDANGNYPTLGDAVMKGKNFNYQNYSDILNNRKFNLLGDPAVKISIPVHRIVTRSINGVAVTSTPDTLKALGKYTITAQVTDVTGNVLTAFNGFAYPTIFDKGQMVTTLANDAGSIPAAFLVQNNLVYRGKVQVTNGNFTYSFIVPKDISLATGNGKFSYYAGDGTIDAKGSSTNIVIGGQALNVANDIEGPAIKAFLNDEKFINGGISNSTPLLIVKLSDSSGINTSGAGIGHDITAVLDNDNRKLFELNAAYEAEIGTYQKGNVKFQLPVLENGPHNLKIKAWDVYNNSSEYLLEFNVVAQDKLEIKNVLNYPNPFTTKTTFWFEHNFPGEDLDVIIKILTIAGRQVKAIRQTINTTGNRSSEVSWNGKDDYGQKVGRGVYIYHLIVRANGKQASTLQKLVIL